MSATFKTKIDYPQVSFRILGSQLADRWVGEDWKFTTDPEYNFLYVDVDMSFDLARRTHKYPRAPFGARTLLGASSYIYISTQEMIILETRCIQFR